MLANAYTCHSMDESTRSPITIRAAVRSTLMRRLRPIPLQHEWVFWYLGVCPEQTDYENHVKELAEVNSIQTFWSCFNHLPLALPEKQSLHLFKKSIKPLWEDPANMYGGELTFRVAKCHSAEFIKEVLLLLIGEALPTSEDDEICGVSFSSRHSSDLVAIWNRNGIAEGSIEQIKQAILQSLPTGIVPQENQIYYKVSYVLWPYNESDKVET